MATKEKKENNTRDSNVVPHRSTNRARACLTSLSRREAVLSCWYGRSRVEATKIILYTVTIQYCTQLNPKTNPDINPSQDQ